MGVIENAIEKLRRTGTTGAAPTGAAHPVSRLQSSWAAEPVNPSTRVVEIDRAQLRLAGYLPELGHELHFAEYYHQIKRPLIRRALADGASPQERMVMVTSALPSDGKTFTSLNLALSIARERDVSVLLVDADFPKAHIGRALDVYEEPGLLDAVADETQDVESYVLRTSVPGLEILPGGRCEGDAAELVASERMARVAERLLARNPRRLVLFDAAPLLLAGDARALLEVPGQVLMVVRAGQTPRHALLDAIGYVDKNKLQGLVLNDAYNTGGKGYFGYGAYGAHGSAAQGDGAAQ